MWILGSQECVYKKGLVSNEVQRALGVFFTNMKAKTIFLIHCFEMKKKHSIAFGFSFSLYSQPLQMSDFICWVLNISKNLEGSLSSSPTSL
jgi:hypothetical protein